MSQSVSSARSLEVFVGQTPRVDHAVVGYGVVVADPALVSAAGSGLVQTAAALKPDETAQFLLNRVVIEQAKGMLMMVYGIDADRAFELLKWRSQATNVKLRYLAHQPIEEFPTLTVGPHGPTRAAIDEVLLTAHLRIPADPGDQR